MSHISHRHCKETWLKVFWNTGMAYVRTLRFPGLWLHERKKNSDPLSLAFPLLRIGQVWSTTSPYLSRSAGWLRYLHQGATKTCSDFHSFLALPDDGKMQIPEVISNFSHPLELGMTRHLNFGPGWSVTMPGLRIIDISKPQWLEHIQKSEPYMPFPAAAVAWKSH